MNVGSVNSVAFAGKIKTTKKGNEYKKTNTGKTVGLSVAVGLTALSYLRRGSRKILSEGFKVSKGKTVLAVAIGTAISTLIFGGIGAIIDGFVNHHRRKKLIRPQWHKAFK